MQADFRLRDRAISVGGLAVFSSEWNELADVLEVKRANLRKYPSASLSEIWRRVGGPSLTISRSIDARFVGAFMSFGYGFCEAPLRGVWVDKGTGDPYGYIHCVDTGPRVTTMRLASALIEEEDRDAMFVAHILRDTIETMGWLAREIAHREVRGGYGHKAKLPWFDSCRCEQCSRDLDVPFTETRWSSIVHNAQVFLEQWELVSWLPGQTAYEIRPEIFADLLQRVGT